MSPPPDRAVQPADEPAGESITLTIDSIRFALVATVLMLIVPRPPSSAHLVFLIGTALLLLIGARRDLSRLTTIVWLLIGAIVVRLALVGQGGSDVLTVTEAAIQRMLAGSNPYGFGYPESRPPGAPFPYGPVALIWYIPAGSALQWLEFGSAVVIAAILAAQGRLVGLALYATMPVLVTLSTDGSNDTSLGLLILLAFMAARRWPLVGAAILGLAVGFKLSALAFVPLFVAWGGWRVAGVIAATTVIAWAPVLSWGIGSFLRSTQMAGDLHSATVWSLGKIVRDLTGERLDILDTLRYVFGGALAIATLPLRRSLDGVILAGTAVYLVTLYSGNWSTFAYFAGIAPLLLWRLDDWLGLESRPLIAWPGRRDVAPAGVGGEAAAS